LKWKQLRKKTFIVISGDIFGHGVRIVFKNLSVVKRMIWNAFQILILDFFNFLVVKSGNVHVQTGLLKWHHQLF
jgi:hypothetical protein